MKVLMINVTCGVGSTGRICTDLARALMNQGHTVKIAYGRGSAPEDLAENAYRVENQAELLWHVAAARLWDRSGLESSRATKALVAWIRQYDPDVIHLHNLHGYYLNVEILFDYLKTCGKRILWTLHDAWAFTGHCACFFECDRFQNGCVGCKQKNEYPKTFHLNAEENWKRKKKAFTGIPGLTLVTPSKWLAGYLPKTILREYPVKVVPNGINTNYFVYTEGDFRKRNDLTNRFVILGVSNVWNARKGLADFYKLAQILDQRFQIVLVGLTKKQLRNLPDGILGIQRTSRVQELAELYSTADVFLNLTYSDNYPTVNLESLCCGTPVITNRTGGSPESIRGENAGFVVEQGNLEQVCLRLEELIAVHREQRRVNYDRKFADSGRALKEYCKLYLEPKQKG